MIPTGRREINAEILLAKVEQQQGFYSSDQRQQQQQQHNSQHPTGRKCQMECRGFADTAVSGIILTRRRRPSTLASLSLSNEHLDRKEQRKEQRHLHYARAEDRASKLPPLMTRTRPGMRKSSRSRHRSALLSSSSSLSAASSSRSHFSRSSSPGQGCLPRRREKMNSMVYTLYGFATVFMVFWSVMWIVHVLALIAGRWKLHRKVTQVPTYETPLPGVSIIKPLMGVDPNLFSNLETFFHLDYPVYELLFCIEDEQDPVLMLVHKLIDKYPSVDAKFFVGGRAVGVNPKINNMQPAYEASKHELILISDSGIRMKEDTLLDMVNYMTDRVGLVHQMPFTCDREGFAAAYEKIFFGTVQSRMYLAADLLRINCHTGMSALIKKALLEEVGGLKAFGVYLAEDFFYAKSLADRGWKVTVCSQPAMQNSGHCEVYSFQARLRRWAKLRVAMLPTTIVLEPLSECLILGACASWAADLLFDWDMLLFYLAHIALWFMFDWTLLCVVQNGPLPFNILEFIIGWLLSETTRPYLFIQAVLDPLIQWRSRVYRLKWGGLAEEVKAKVKY